MISSEKSTEPHVNEIIKITKTSTRSLQIQPATNTTAKQHYHYNYLDTLTHNVKDAIVNIHSKSTTPAI